MMQNKKGLMRALNLLISILGIAFLFFIFFKYSVLPSDRVRINIQEETNRINDDILLLNYLRTPTGDQTIADLIVKSYQDKNYDQLKEETDSIFKKVYGEDTIWRLTIGNEEITNYIAKFLKPSIKSETIIPSPYDKDIIKIKLEIRILK